MKSNQWTGFGCQQSYYRFRFYIVMLARIPVSVKAVSAQAFHVSMDVSSSFETLLSKAM